jgi:hypothetical protein
LTTTQLKLFQAGDAAGVRRVDKELELCVVEKERSINALRQHMREHNCQQT